MQRPPRGLFRLTAPSPLWFKPVGLKQASQSSQFIAVCAQVSPSHNLAPHQMLQAKQERERSRSRGREVPQLELQGLQVRISELGEQLAAFQARERAQATAVDVDFDARALRGKVEALQAAAAEARSLAAQAEGAARETQEVVNEHFREACDPDSDIVGFKTAWQVRQDEDTQCWDPVLVEATQRAGA